MPSKGGLALRGGDSTLRGLELLCSIVILAIFSYFLAYLSRHDQNIPTWMKAVEGISGAAVIYTAFATLLTCFLGGITGFAILAIILDLLFCGAMLAIAILTRAGRHTGGQYSPLANMRVRDAKCQTAVFAVSIIAAFLFLITLVMAILLMKHHKKEKKYGPGPSNNYTSGTGKKAPFWKRGKKSKAAHHDTEAGALGAGSAAIVEEKHGHHHNGVTDSSDGYGGSANKYAEPAVPTHTHNNAGYAPYSTQQSMGTTTDGYGNSTTSQYGHSTTGTGNVIHDPNPYAQVHNNGAVHTEHKTARY